VEDLLDVSRIISGSLRLQIRPLALGPVIEVAVANARPGAETKRVRLDLMLHPSAATISGDPVRIQQIVSNLLVNALKFTPSGGKVEVRLEGPGRAVHTPVEETGWGRSSADAAHIYGRHERQHTKLTRELSFSRHIELSNTHT